MSQMPIITRGRGSIFFMTVMLYVCRGGENRTPITGPPALHTNRCTTPRSRNYSSHILHSKFSILGFGHCLDALDTCLYSFTRSQTNPLEIGLLCTFDCRVVLSSKFYSSPNAISCFSANRTLLHDGYTLTRRV